MPKQTEEKLTEEDQKDQLLQMAIDDLRDLDLYIQELSTFLPLAFCAINPFGLVITVNLAFQTLTGFKESEIIGEKAEILFPDKEKFRDLLSDKVLKKEGKISKEMRLVTKRKKEVPVSVSIATRRDENKEVIGYFVALFDMSRFEELRKDLEKKVKERTKDLEMRTEEIAESRLALMNILEDVEEARKTAENEREKTLTIITNFSDGLLLFDKANNLSLANFQAEKYLDTDIKKMIGQNISELVNIPAFKKIIECITDPKSSKIRKMYRQELALGKESIFEISTIFPKEGKQESGILVVLHDVSREKVVEKLKTEFVSLAAHQLRTPLSAIKWTLKMLLDGDLGKVEGEQREYIKRTYQSNERMISLINDLLNVTRIEEGRYLYKPVPTDLGSVIDFVINSLKEKIEKRKVKVVFARPQKKLLKVKVDVEKIRLAIHNLINNAVSYTHVGGKVTVSLRNNKEGVEFKVSDNGIGISKDEQKRVFTKFFRGNNAVRKETTGTGLGLYITKNVIEAHGGKIWFESEEGKGSTFYFTLPAAKN